MSKKVNHIILNDELQIDLRNDTVTADALKKGVTAHDRSGEIITGTLEDPVLQEKTVIENGEIVPDEGYYGLSKVKINVPIPEGYIQPSGSIELDENKTYDITNYKNAIVRVLRPQLYTPSITLSENRILTIEDNVKNGAFTTEHDIYIDSAVGATVAMNYPTKTAVFDLTTLNLAIGSYNLTVKAKGTYMVDSEKSTTIMYTVLPDKLTAPTISIIDDELYIRDNEGYATFFNILVDGEAKDSISKFGGTGTFIYNLTNLDLSAGEYTITVIAEADGFISSEASNSVTYVMVPPTLATPIVQLNENFLDISDTEGIATSFNILVNGEIKDSVSKTGAITVVYDLTELGLSTGTYVITVVAQADGYLDSNPSVAVTYTVAPRVYRIVTILSGCVPLSTNVANITAGETATLQFNAENGYVFPETINVTGATYVWDSTTGTVVLSNPTGNVNVIIECIEMPQLDPAVITLDGDTLNIYDASGLATSATIYVNGEPMATVEIEGEVEEPLDPEFNHYGVIPEGWTLEYHDAEGELHFGEAGDPFPSDKSVYANGAIYYGGEHYGYSEEAGGWLITENYNPYAEIKVLASIDGIPVTKIESLEGQIGTSIIALTIPTSVTKFNSVGVWQGTSGLTSITYLGTMDQWNAIEFGDNWNYGCLAITVTCTDGTITIPAYGS